MQRLYIRSGKTRKQACEYVCIAQPASGQQVYNDDLESNLEGRDRRYGPAFLNYKKFKTEKLIIA